MQTIQQPYQLPCREKHRHLLRWGIGITGSRIHSIIAVVGAYLEIQSIPIFGCFIWFARENRDVYYHWMHFAGFENTHTSLKVLESNDIITYNVFETKLYLWLSNPFYFLTQISSSFPPGPRHTQCWQKLRHDFWQFAMTRKVCESFFDDYTKWYDTIARNLQLTMAHLQMIWPRSYQVFWKVSNHVWYTYHKTIRCNSLLEICGALLIKA